MATIITIILMILICGCLTFILALKDSSWLKGYNSCKAHGRAYTKKNKKKYSKKG